LEDHQRPEWEILARLAAIVSGGGAGIPASMVDEMLIRQLVAAEVEDPHSLLSGRDAEAILSALAPRTGPERVVDLMVRAGAYGDGFGHAAQDSAPGLSLSELQKHPHGIDLGPLQPRIPEILRTPDATIELCPEVFASAAQALVVTLDAGEQTDRYDLTLV